MPTLFFGLGPAGDVTEELLKAKCEEVAPVTELRMRGRCAFIDVADDETAQKMVAALNNEHINSSRLSVQVSHASAGTTSRRNDRGGDRRGGGDGIFIGLGPKGDVTEDDLKARIEEVAPIKALRMRGQCAFLDCETDQDARKVIESLDQQYINSSRLSVQYSRQNQDRSGRGGRGGGFDDRKRYRSPSRDRRRYRSDSRDYRRRHRSDSRDYRRRHRSDSRDRRHRRDRSDSRDKRRHRDDTRGRDREEPRRSPSAPKSSRSHS